MVISLRFLMFHIFGGIARWSNCVLARQRQKSRSGSLLIQLSNEKKSPWLFTLPETNMAPENG